MKISSLILSNYKSYNTAEINFHKWLTVITGESDSGKSAIVQALKLVITNRPNKDSYRTKNSDRTEVKLCSDIYNVARVKSSKLNQYLVNKNGKNIASPKAIKTDVPEIVSKTLNLSEINIQEQKNNFFMIDISPGKRAKLLNKVAGLSIVDKSLKAIGSDIREQTSDVRHLNNEKSKYEEYNESTEWAVSADKKLSNIEKIQNRISANEKRLQRIDDIVFKIKEERQRLTGLLPSECAEEVKIICDLFYSIDNDYETKDRLSIILQDIKSMSEQYNEITLIDVSTLKSLYKNITNHTEEIKRIQDIMYQIKQLQVSHNEIDKEYLVTMDEIQKMNVCPTCGSLLEE